MINWDKIDKKISIKKIVLPLFVAILIILFIIYFKVIHKLVLKNNFASEMERIASLNENSTFSIEKIYLCSSANALDSSKDQDLDTLDLYQYTDIAIYLNNYNENGLTKSNTIKNLYIDNIDLQLVNNAGSTSLAYTNLLKIGSKNELENMIKDNTKLQNDKIDFKIVNTNEQNNMASYENPTFYADCSNPITLKYINKLNTQYSIGEDNSATFDGAILKKARIPIDDINCRIKFKINIVSNDDMYHSAWVNFQIPLDDIYKGASLKSKTTVGNEYNFFNWKV